MRIEYKDGLIIYIEPKYFEGIGKNSLPLTKFGQTTYNKTQGYLIIGSGENKGKLLHRLIYCYENGLDYNNKYFDIHHINNNKLDNRIFNLNKITHSKHMELHNNGENNPMYNEKHSNLTKFKMSLKTAINTHNGLPFRVYTNQGAFKYRYPDENGNRKSLTAKTLPELRNKVLKAGQIWLPTLNDMKLVYKSIGGEL